MKKLRQSFHITQMKIQRKKSIIKIDLGSSGFNLTMKKYLFEKRGSTKSADSSKII